MGKESIILSVKKYFRFYSTPEKVSGARPSPTEVPGPYGAQDEERGVRYCIFSLPILLPPTPLRHNLRKEIPHHDVVVAAAGHRRWTCRVRGLNLRRPDTVAANNPKQVLPYDGVRLGGPTR